MLCAHLDVVPVNTESWEEDPFGANVKDGFIYARGTIDVKQILMVFTYLSIFSHLTAAVVQSVSLSVCLACGRLGARIQAATDLDLSCKNR